MRRCRMWILLVSLQCLLTIQPSFTQTSQRQINGTVKDEKGDPLQGITVVIKGSSSGTTTDDDGKYSISVPTNALNTILIFSSTGYLEQEKLVSNDSVVDITMVNDPTGMEEVVVIGYGTAKRKDVTGAVASIQATKLEQEAPRSVQDLLRGNAAGMIIGQGSSAKADATLLVRGSGTLKAGNSPLNVVDGVIFDGTFADLNPNDIQSIDILKDASATAVFGSRAANGVVLITTKKGASGKPVITINGNVGFVENSGMPRVMTADEFLHYRYDYEVGRRTDQFNQDYPEMFVDPRQLSGVNQLDWYNYDQNTPVASVTDEQLLTTWLSRLELRNPEIDNYFANNLTNWQDQVFHRGFQQDYSASVSNRTKNSSYHFSVNMVDRQGVVVGDRFKNFRTRLNFETKVTSFLKVGTNTNFAARNEGFLRADWGQSAVISPYGSNNIGDPNNPNQRFPTGDVTPVNPFFDNLYRDRKDMYNTLNSTIYGVISLPFGIELQSNFTPSYTWREYYNHESSKNPQWEAAGGRSERRFEKTFNWQMDNVLRWKRRFDDHSVEVTLLQNAEKRQYWNTIARTSQYSPSDILGYHRIQAGSVPLNESNDTYSTGDALMGRLFYSFQDKYMLTASVRRDGFSAFGAQNPRATFPALAFGWDLSSEKFMQHTSSWLDMAKLRVSWGRNGNRDIGIYDALSDMTSGLHPYIDASGNLYLYSQLYVNRMANLGLKWENKASYNIGLDFSIFKGRLSGAIDAYTAITNDLLVDRVLPEIIGFNSVAANLGELKNTGFEFSLNGTILKQRNFNWNSTVIFMLNRREIVSLYGDMIFDYDTNGNIIGQREADDIQNRWFIGQDPDRIWHYQRDGIWQVNEKDNAAQFGLQPGDFKYTDQNGDGVMTNDDRVFQQYRTPRFRWTWRNDFSYKNFNLSIFVYSNWGQRETFNRAANNSNFADRATDYAIPRWTPDNPINDYARIGSRNVGDNYVNRSFIRLDNISLSYGLPAKLINPYKIQGLRISASVRNVAFWAPDWTFGDPEAGGHLTDLSITQPTPRTYNLSFNLTL